MPFTQEATIDVVPEPYNQEKIPVDEQEVCEYCTVNMCTDCSVNVSEDEKGPVICVDCDDMGFQAIVKGEIPRLHYGDYNDGTL